MKWPARFSALFFCLALPALGEAQQFAQVTCAHPNDYVYLYSSITTLDVRSTLQCGQEVQVLTRYDNFVSVRTESGQTGYVPLDNILFLKTKPGATLPPPSPEPARPRIAYDTGPIPKEDSASRSESAKSLILPDGTPVHLKLEKTISSANAQVDDEVNFTVSENVVVDGLLVVPKGALATGMVNEAEPKRSLGRGGKLSILINLVRLTDNEKVGLRSGREGKGSSSTAGVIFPSMHGKDITYAGGTEFTAYVNSDIRLKRENFHPPADASPAAPQGQPQNAPRSKTPLRQN